MLTLVVHSTLISDHLQIRVAQGHGWPCTDFCSCGSCHPHMLAFSTVKDTESLRRFGSFILFFTPQEPVCKNLFSLFFIFSTIQNKTRQVFSTKMKTKTDPRQTKLHVLLPVPRSVLSYLFTHRLLDLNE